MKPERMIMRAGRKMGDALGRKLYSSLFDALGELVFNGIDACTKRGTDPVIEVRFWKKGEHPLSPNGPAISVLDYGTGLTPSALIAYCMVGESVHEKSSTIHGKHGVGKFAALALGSGEEPYYYVTTNLGEGGDNWMFKILFHFFEEKGFEPVKVSKTRVGLPTVAPFTEIFIPNLQEGLTPQTVSQELTKMLPLRPWQVFVQGKAVARRQFKSQASATTPDIPALKGPVTIELAIAEYTAKRDEVFLVDSDSGRVVGNLNDLPPANKAELELILLDPRLCGQIFVRGLEKKSATGRKGLQAPFWTSAMGQKLIEVLNAYAVPEARKLLKDEESPKGSLEKLVTQMGELFRKGFGDPDLTGFKPNRKRNPPPGGGGGGGSGGGGSGGGGSSGGGSGGGGSGGGGSGGCGGDETPEGVYVKVEETTYQVMTFPMAENMPANLRKGNVICINTKHPEVQRLMQSKSPRLMMEAMVEFIVMVHLIKSRGDISQTFGLLYQLKNRLLGK